MACGEEPHSRKGQGRKRNSLQDRERACKAWNRNCNRCGSRGHLEKQCRTRLKEEEKIADTEATQGEGEDRSEETRRDDIRRWQHPGDHQDRGGEWEKQYGGEEQLQQIPSEGEAEAAGATMSTPACQCLRDAAKECAYGIAPQCAPEEWAERNRRERGMPPMIRLPEDTEEEAKGLEEPEDRKKKEGKKWSIRLLKGRKDMKEEESESQTGTKEGERRIPLSIMKKAGAEGRTVYGMEDSHEAREKEKERCRKYQSYYMEEEGQEDNTQEHEEISDVENESGYESYYACREADEIFFKEQQENRSTETRQGNEEGGETEQSPPPRQRRGDSRVNGNIWADVGGADAAADPT